MSATTTTAFRTLIARAIMGESVTLLPVTARLGTGRYDPVTGIVTPPAPDDTGLIHPVLTALPLTVTRQGSEIRMSVSVPGNTATFQITESGVFLADGTPAILESFQPITLQPGLTFEFTQTLFPETA